MVVAQLNLISVLPPLSSPIRGAGEKSLCVTLPIEMVRGLGWKEKQKIVVKRVKRGLLINDWRRS